MGASDARFEHAAAPDRNLLGVADVVNLLGFAESSYTSNFDIDEAACAGLDRNGRSAGADDRLIEANGGAQLLLQPGVIENVVIPERLLDHQQIELIEGPEMFDLIECVRRVRVTT